MAAALAKVIRGGRSGASAQLLLPAMGRRILQQGVLPHLGSSPAAPAAGMGRLMHTSQWRNSGPSRGSGTRAAEQRALLFGGRRVLSQNREHMRSELFISKRLRSDGPFDSGPGNGPWIALNIAFALGLVYALPQSIRNGSWFIKDDRRK